MGVTTLPSTTNDSGMDVNAPVSATDQTSNPVPMEVDKEMGEESTNIVMVTAPAWLAALNMDVYLQECSDVKEWQALVQSLYKFEEGNAINRVRYSKYYSFYR